MSDGWHLIRWLAGGTACIYGGWERPDLPLLCGAWFYLQSIDCGDLAGHVDEDVPNCVICEPDWPHRVAIMKFGALLRTSAAGAPNLQTLFHCYKLLKKRLKHLPERQSPDHPNNEAEGVSEDELLARQRTFVTTLNNDVSAFNDLYIDKEEDSVILLRNLEDAAEQAGDNLEAVAHVFKEFVDFHGEVSAGFACYVASWSTFSCLCGGVLGVSSIVPLQHPGHNHGVLSQMLLLVHWSILAYTGLVKILKKHYKRTGLRVRAPHLDNLLSQPFCSVEVCFRPTP